jgi:hypothetical protein
MTRLERDAQRDPDNYPVNDYLGDGFEFFVELFLMLYPVDKRIGVCEYKPVQENDNGVDGLGLNIRGDKCVVQVKYRSNTQGVLTGNLDHLSNMFSYGDVAYGVTTDHANRKNIRHFVFTTAEGLHFYTDKEMYKSKVKCFGYKHFRVLLDDNVMFWNTALEIVTNLKKQ